MKNMKLVYKTIIIFMLCECLNACSLLTDTIEVKVDQKTKDYCLFAEYSYWIYQDSATLTMDSVVIDKPIEYDFSQQGWEYGGGDYLESYTTFFSLYSQDTIYSLRIDLSTGYKCDNSYLYTCSFGWDIIYHNGKINKTCEYYRNTILIDKKDSYSINGITYSDVKIFKKDIPQKENKIYYFAKHVGLIREETYKNDNIAVKNLIKYNIKPYNQ